MARKYRNYHSRKLIKGSTVRVNRQAPYLRKIYFKIDDIKNINEDFFNNKYFMGQDIFFDKDPLPNIYYVNEIVLIPKNKNTVFAYWEVKDDTYNYLKESFDIFDNITMYLYKNDKLYRKIENLSRVGSYYINNIDANTEYRAVMGFENIYGDFFEIASSNTAIVPSGKVSDNRATIWGRPIIKDNKILYLEKYSKDYLPEETVFRQEILDKEVLNFENEEDYFNSEYFKKYKENSSEEFIGSSIK